MLLFSFLILTVGMLNAVQGAGDIGDGHDGRLDEANDTARACSFPESGAVVKDFPNDEKTFLTLKNGRPHRAGDDRSCPR